MRLGNRSTKEQKGAKFRNTFLFLKIIVCKIDFYHWILTKMAKNFVYIFINQAIETCQCTLYDCKEKDKYRQKNFAGKWQ